MLKLDIPLDWTTPKRNPILNRVLRDNDTLSLDDINEMSKYEYQQFQVFKARAEYEKVVWTPGATEADIFVAHHVFSTKIDFLNKTLK